MNKKRSLIFSPLTGIATLCALIFYACTVIFFLADVNAVINPKRPEDLSTEQKNHLDKILEEKFAEEKGILKNLPYQTVAADLFINAESAILIDTETGNILFEKNADEPIPPASMTKLVEMYVVFEAVEEGSVTLDDIVPLPPQSWAINLPRDASIMFLAQGQTVTLRELLLGLAIASGNDASIAVANYVAGSMDEFVERMNRVVEGMGLEQTHFVESSGYSELNVTTAREFAAFSRMYIKSFPEAITDYHSKEVLRYPLEHNLPKSQQYQGDSQAVIQYNTNKLLGVLKGCDGLKTGFIYESGYNLALTAKRDSRRFLSVTMRGPGIGSVQGNRYRTQDGTTLMEYAFSSFADYLVSEEEKKSHSVTVGVTGTFKKAVTLIPAYDEAFTVPFIAGSSPEEAASMVKTELHVPKALYLGATCGSTYGTITYTLNGVTLQTVPLVADRTVVQTSLLKKAWGKAQYFFITKVFSQENP